MEFTVFVSEPFRYQEIAEKVTQLYQLGMTRHQIAKSLGEEYKTISRALKWKREL